MKRKYLVMLLLSFGFINGLFAQENEDAEREPERSGGEENFWDNVYVGGSFWMQFGSVTYIDVSPMVGYRFTDKFSAGPGIVYQYLKYDSYGQEYSTNSYGGRLFARHTIFQQFFAQAQYENISTEFLYINGNGEIDEIREWVPGFLLGGGIAQPLGRRGAIIISGMYNFLHDEIKSPYPSAWIFNVGFTF
jgi:hypothetical protein